MSSSRSVSLVTLGCARNEVDSEELAARLAAGGWTLRGEGEDADVVLVNTCGFIQAAKQESIDELLIAADSGAKVAAVVRGEVDAYVHAGGQYEWDSAAPVAVARASGLHASRIDGSELTYNQARPWMPDLLVCRPELAGVLLDAIGSANR